MKPLTIEEIKQLKENEWLYIVSDIYKTTYWNVIFINTDFIIMYTTYGSKQFKFEEYGKTWVAYKNKEQAECDNSYDLLKVKYEIVLKEYAKLKRKATKYNFMTKTIDKEITKQAEQKLIELRGKE